MTTALITVTSKTVWLTGQRLPEQCHTLQGRDLQRQPNGWPILRPMRRWDAVPDTALKRQGPGAQVAAL